MGVWGKQEGPGLPDPELGFRRGVSYYGAHFWKLVGANLLFVVCALPLVTLPGALCALNRVCVRIYRDGRCFLWSDFWEEFRSAWAKALAPGLLFGLLLFGGYYFMSLGDANRALAGWSMLFWFAGLLLTGSGLIWASWYFILEPMLPLGNGALLKNAVLLAFLCPGKALGTVGILLLSGLLSAALMPVFLFPLLLCWFATVQYTLCCLLQWPIGQYILKQEAEASPV